MFSNIKAEVCYIYGHKKVKTNMLEIEVTSLKKRLLKLEEKIDENDSYERRDTLVLSGSYIYSP